MTSIDAVLEEIALAADAIGQANRAQFGEGAEPQRAAIGFTPPLNLAFEDPRTRYVPLPTAAPNWASLSASDDASFINDIYQMVLGRAPERELFFALLDDLSADRIDRIAIARSLLASEEATGRGMKIPGLRSAMIASRLSRMPAIGRLFRLVATILLLPRHLAVLERRLARLETRHARALFDIDAIVNAIAQTQIGVGSIGQHLMMIDGNIHALSNEANALSIEANAQAEWIEKLVDRMEVSDERAVALQAQVDSKLEESKATLRRALFEANQIRNMMTAPRTGSVEVGSTPKDDPELADHGLDDLYLAFENKFRGSPETIAARCERYLPMVAATAAVSDGGLILDIGCGRGEWLSLMKEQGHACRGIDLNVAMVEAAKARGHDVIFGDAIAYLRGLPDESLGVISAFHLIEHLSFRDLVELLDEANRTLKKGGAILFETPNPECLIVGACNFYYDPTHNNPLPPELMRFLANARAFSSARIVRTDSDCELTHPESGFDPVDVNSWFQVPMDYALYAVKA
jgi:SAM-dependent methyltransferase/uncharacterized coiled-coil protein SlyX